MNFWHMQLHPDDKSEWSENDIFKILKQRLIGCSGPPMTEFEKVKVGDVVLIRHGGKVLSLVKVLTKPDVTPQELRDEFIWFDRYAKVSILNNYDNVSISGKGWFIPKTLMPIDNDIAFEYVNDLYTIAMMEIEKEKKAEIKNLLEYKKQIILQGPPGTGKTKLAKEIADKILNTTSEGSTPKEIIEEFFQSTNNVRADNLGFEKRLKEFYTFFPKDGFVNMDLNDYCIGKGNRTNFCWWIEVGLSAFGKFSPGQSGNYVVYFSGKANDYVVKKFNEPAETIFPRIKDALDRLINRREIDNALHYFGESFILKILNSYYPEEYLPINGKKALENANKLFGKEVKRKSNFELNKMLLDEFHHLKSKFNSDKTSLNFMHFLFRTFNLNEDGLQYKDNKVTVAKRKPFIIQFHPSYTYEDFVRGIVAETSDKGIKYTTQDKTLAEIAKEAFENQHSDYVLIIDEINRANLSTVLGELIYALEYRYYFNETEEKQNESKVQSLYALVDEETDEKNRELVLPENLYIIGTMNTADRSVGHIDYAIRRRFAFVDVLPKSLISELGDNFKKDLFVEVSNLFIENYTLDVDYNSEESKKEIKRSKHVSEEFDPKDVWLGHSYFIQQFEKDIEGKDDKTKPIDFQLRLQYEIKPILREYVKDGILKKSALLEIEKLGT